MQSRTFHISTLGCRVNHYESQQIAALLRQRGWQATEAGDAALRIVHTCSVTREAGAKSRQTARRLAKAGAVSASIAALPAPCIDPGADDCLNAGSEHRNITAKETPRSLALPILQEKLAARQSSTWRLPSFDAPSLDAPSPDSSALKPPPRVIITGCWASSNADEARRLPGVEAVIGHHENLAQELHRLLDRWEPAAPPAAAHDVSLPLLHERQSGHQRAFLKIQDGCDAHCTYCIIPSLRPKLWSKSIDDAVQEARQLTAAGHRELVLTGIFLGAFGRETALRRRQNLMAGDRPPLAALIDALCRNVPDLQRLRLSSLEPGDMSMELLQTLRRHRQVVPHFHLPLQSGSNAILRRMNRQYDRDDYLHLIETIRTCFDRPALTTDVIVGFPGETEAEFARTAELVRQVEFLHVHAFTFSPRPGTAAARWTRDVVPIQIARGRLAVLQQLEQSQSLAYRRQFIGQVAQVLVEASSAHQRANEELRGYLHGRCERYFPIHFAPPREANISPGDAVDVRIECVTPNATSGQML